MLYNNNMNNMRMPAQNGCRKTKPAESGCVYNTEYIDQFPIAMAYVPWQEWNKIYDPDCAINYGTIFPELTMPFHCASPACRNTRGGRV